MCSIWKNKARSGFQRGLALHWFFMLSVPLPFNIVRSTARAASENSWDTLPILITSRTCFPYHILTCFWLPSPLTASLVTHWWFLPFIGGFLQLQKNRKAKTIRISVPCFTRSLSQGWFGNSAVLSGRQIPPCLRSDSATSPLVMPNGCNLSRKYPLYKSIFWKPREERQRVFSSVYFIREKSLSYKLSNDFLHCTVQVKLTCPLLDRLLAKKNGFIWLP